MYLIIIELTDWPCFHFIKIFIMDLTISLGKVDSLAINRIILTKKKVAISVFGLFLW